MPAAKLYAPHVKLAIIIATMVLPTVALAESKPTPQPAIGAACPTGYQRSGGACVPGSNTRCRAFPRAGGSCPVGYTASFDYCVETGCQSR
jgi:hypothetical protein